MKIRFTILFLVFALVAGVSFGQNTNLGLEAAYERGFLLPHRASMAHLPDGSVQAFQVRGFIQTDGSKPWHNLYNNPEFGVVVKGFDLGNHELLGYGLGIGMYFSAPVVATDRFRWNLEMAAGPGITSKAFNETDNYQNIAIGSHGNAFIMLGQRFSYQLTPKLDVTASLSFNHFSNAAFALPNLGLNYPDASIGLRFIPSGLTTVDSSFTHDKVKGKWSITMGFGVKEASRPFRQKSLTSALMFERLFGLSKKSGITAGTDVFFNGALYATEEADGNAIPLWKGIQNGVRVGYLLKVDRLETFIHMGIYTLDHYRVDGLLYHRAGLRYMLSDHFGMNLSLKTHFFKADFFEYGLVYSF